MSHIPVHIIDGPTETSQPPRKKAKVDSQGMHAPTQPAAKPQTPAKPPAPAHPVIDMIPNGPPGDMFIKVSFATQNGSDPANTTPGKKTVLIRVHSLLLMLHSSYFRDLLSGGGDGNDGSGVQKSYTEISPWTLPADWDSSAFLDWCVMVCGMSSVYNGGIETEKPAAQTTTGAKQQSPVTKTEEGTGERQAKKASKGVEGGKISRFPRIVALSEKLGCTRAMRQHCGMPLWKFFGPNGEADEEGLKAKGLDVV
jgi:hypothetical protein